jgi:CRP/FNR family transcriptional regulator
MPRQNKTLTMDDIKVSCGSCSLAQLCLPHGMNAKELDELDKIVVRHQPYQPGEHLFRAGDSSRSMYALRSGALKSYCTTEDGEEQVIGFTLPGELLGLDGMENGSYASNALVLETSSICELPFNRIEELCLTLPGLHRQMMRVVGKEITSDQRMLLLLGKRSAEERLATFLLSLSKRYKSRGLSATEFNLPMSRQDIGNYLGLAIETVSRLFAQFQNAGLLRVNRRQVVLTDLEKLSSIVEGCVSLNST